jgi:hypothetical protein
MKKMATEAMMNTNGGKWYLCKWCGRKLNTTWWRFKLHRLKERWIWFA